MGGSTTISTSETRIESLRLQSSTFGATLPLVAGVTRVPGNLLWVGGFTSIPHTTTTRAGKGGGVKQKNTTYTYTTHVAMGLCEGPIVGVPRIWRGKKQFTGGILPSEINTTSQAYTVPGTGGTVTVTNSATWVGTVAVYYTGNVNFGDGSTTGPVYLAEGADYSVSAGVYTFGVSAGGRAVTIEYQYTTAASEETGLADLKLTKFSGYLGQTTWSLLSTQFSSQAIPYSGIAYVAAQAYDLGGDASIENHNFEVQGSLAYHLGSSVPDCDPALFALQALTNGRFGAVFPASRLNFGLWSRYCRAAGLLLSPALTTQTTAADLLERLGLLTNTTPIWSGGALRMMPYGDQTLTANGATYTPYVTPVYAVDDTVLLPTGGGGEPVQVSITPQADAPNHIRIEFLDRSADYNIAIAEAKDQADIDLYGLRSGDVIQAHWIADAAIARNIAQLLLQRSLYVRTRYTFRLPAAYALLEPMDLVTITSSALGLSSVAVRVTQVEEGEDGDLSIEAEEFPSGVANAATYTPQAGAGFSQDFNAAPGSVLAPVLFEAPVEKTVTGLEVYAAVVGTGANWGGCTVWVSLDGVSYYAAGTVGNGGARYGRLTGAISAGNLPVAINDGQLLSVSANDAAALSSLCYIGGSSPEYLAYQGATLTGPLAYTLSGLVRGQYGTATVAHATNDAFVRVDDGIGKSGPLDLSLIGRTIYFKFTSYNVFQSAEQDLADVPAYTYTIAGTFANAAPPAPIGLTAGTYERQVSFTITPATTAAQDTQYEILEHSAATPYSSAVVVWTGYSLTPSIPKSDTTTRYYWVRARRRGIASPPFPSAASSGIAGSASLTATPVLASLTRPALTVLSYSDGSTFPPGAFDSANGMFVLQRDSADLIAAATLSLVSTTNCTVQFNTAANSPVSGQPKGYYRVTALTADNGSAVLRATYGGTNYDLTLTVARVRQGFEIVSALPTTNLFEGRIVFLTTDDKLYRYNGSAWTSAVPATDIAGQLAAAQIGDGAIGAAKFASGLEPVSLVTSVPTTLSTRTVFNTTDGKIYRWNGSAYVASIPATDLSTQITSTQISDGAISTPKLATGSVTANAIAANSISASALQSDSVTAGKIQSGAVTATAIAAQAITAKHVLIADLENLVPNPSGIDNADGWLSMTRGNESGVFHLQRAGSRDDYGSTWFAVEPGDEFSVTFEAKWISGQTNPTYVGLNTATDLGAAPTYAWNGAVVTNTTGAWVTGSGTVTVPAGHRYARVWCQASDASGGPYSIWRYRNIRIIRRKAANLIVDGAITAQKLAAESVTANALQAGSITAAKISIGALSENLVLNPGAEGGNTEGWLVDGTGSLTTTTSQRFSGSYAFHIPGTEAVTGVVSRAVPVTPGMALTVKVRLFGTPATGGLIIRWYGSLNSPSGGYVTNSNYTSYAELVFLGNTPAAWTAYEYKVVIPTGVYWFSLAIIKYAGTGYELFFDDVEITRSIDASYIANLNADVITANTITARKLTNDQGVDLLTIVPGSLNTALTAYDGTEQFLASGSVNGIAFAETVSIPCRGQRVGFRVTGLTKSRDDGLYYDAYSAGIGLQYSTTGGSTWTLLGQGFSVNGSLFTYQSFAGENFFAGTLPSTGNIKFRVIVGNNYSGTYDYSGFFVDEINLEVLLTFVK